MNQCAHIDSDGTGCRVYIPKGETYCLSHRPIQPVEERDLGTVLWQTVGRVSRNELQASAGSAIAQLLRVELANREKVNASPVIAYPRELMFDRYRPTAKQDAFHMADKRFMAFIGGIRSGKTHSAARECLRRILRDRHKREGHLHYWLLSPTFPTGRVQMRKFFEVVGDKSDGLFLDYKSAEKTLLLNGDITIEFRTANDPKSLIAESLNGAWLDEAARMKPEAFDAGVRQRVTDQQGWAVFSTSPWGQNWFYETIYREATERNNPDYGAVVAFTADNTSVPGLAEEVEKERARLTGALEVIYKRDYEASFDVFEGQIYSDFAESIHVFDDRDIEGFSFVETRYGQDWGTKHPGVLLVGKRTSDGVWYILDEISEPGQIESWWVERANAFVGKHGHGPIYADTENLSARKAYSQSGLHVKPADKSVLPGINRVMECMSYADGTPGLMIHRRCRNLIRELKTYRWTDSLRKEEPVKEKDDACDALRYLLFRRDHIPIT